MVDRGQVREAERARYLAARYPQLLGLRIVSWGAVTILLALTIGPAVTGPVWWAVLGLFLASIPAAVALTWLSKIYYRRRFGEVRRKPESGLEILGWFVAFGVLGVLYGTLLRHAVGDNVISLPGLMGAAMLASTAWRMGQFAWHRLVLAGILALVCALPLGLLAPSGRHPFVQSDGLLLAVYGVFIAVIGLLDHWLLVRAFGPGASGQRQ